MYSTMCKFLILIIMNGLIITMFEAHNKILLKCSNKSEEGGEKVQFRIMPYKISRIKEPLKILF